MPQLLILRHGQAKSNHIDGDFARELTQKGKKEVEVIAHSLRERQLFPEMVWSSTATRTLQTSEICLQTMAIDIPIQSLPILYLAELNTLKKQLTTCPSTIQRLLIVGHNPGLEELLNQLLKNRNQRYYLATANLAVINIQSNWQLLKNADLEYFTGYSFS
ncbi:MAG: hypothetical protein RL637_1264 [Pseudomonadota bacterium]|jgi:phosphohistidine phosphatase